MDVELVFLSTWFSYVCSLLGSSLVLKDPATIHSLGPIIVSEPSQPSPSTLMRKDHKSLQPNVLYNPKPEPNAMPHNAKKDDLVPATDLAYAWLFLVMVVLPVSQLIRGLQSTTLLSGVSSAVVVLGEY